MAVHHFYHVVRHVDGIVYFVDEAIAGTTFKSVTNAAEEVVLELFEQFGDVRMVYRDTEGDWGELAHDRGAFTGFLPWAGSHP